jgi:hypothetical protein
MQRYINDGLWNPWPYKFENVSICHIYDRRIAISRIEDLSEGHAKYYENPAAPIPVWFGYV